MERMAGSMPFSSFRAGMMIEMRGAGLPGPSGAMS